MNYLKSNSNLLNYLGLLLSDDESLKKFLVDPITEAEGKHGITKAERAVLRRTVAHLSNKSVNGYTVSRHLDSYRRSLRLLQNVLHNVGSKMIQDSHKKPETEENAVLYPFATTFFVPNVSGPANFTCKTNADVDKYGGAYATSFPTYTVYLSNKNPTVKDVLDAVNEEYFSSPVMPYTTVTIGGEPYVKEFIPLSTYPIIADLSNDCYNLAEHPDADYVFWFYSINGTANPYTTGGFGVSFANKTLNPGDTVFWQLIAPDARYGFKKCELTTGNEYA